MRATDSHAGAQGARLLPRRAFRRSPGSRCHVDSARSCALSSGLSPAVNERGAPAHRRTRLAGAGRRACAAMGGPPGDRSSTLPPVGASDAVVEADAALQTQPAAEVEALAARLSEADAEILETGGSDGLRPDSARRRRARHSRDGLSAAAAILVVRRRSRPPARLPRRRDARGPGVGRSQSRSSRCPAGRRRQRWARVALPEGIIVADDLGPADVAELGTAISAIALASGGITGHAAIVARSLGIPMVVGVGAALLEIPEGAEVIVDGDAGAVLVDPRPSIRRRRAARRRPACRRAAGEGDELVAGGHPRRGARRRPRQRRRRRRG